ncbi:MAG: aminotransferase class III-fold pyridoxal phosphate-dependent enzyme [Alphaproteobacteria bacterium]|nr:aminotransferase class III-fold pyridoxal phosphate-dependent enzyme [Alphaproteobacteria bacterium]
MQSLPHPRWHNQGEAVGPMSRAAFARANAITPGGSMRSAPFFAPQPPYAMRGEGCWMTDVDGRRVFDCANNFFSLVHGHAFPPVVQALHEAIDRGTAFGLPTESETQLAEAIRQRSPELEQIRFVGTGTEAVMFAIKAARAITGRPMIAKFEGAYHGAYDYAEVSLDSSPENWGDDPVSTLYAKGTPASVATDVLVLPFDKPADCQRLIAAHATRLAAVLFDPLSSRIAMVPATAELCAVLQETCRQHGILLVLDEVVSYRLGVGGAYQVFGLKPDLVALAKIIGGGLPGGAVAGPARHMAVFDHTKGKPPVSHGGTFSANPLTMVAGLACLAAYDQAAAARLNRLGESLRAMLGEQFMRRELPAQATGMGSLFRLHLRTSAITSYRTSLPSAAEKRALAAIHLAALERGFLLTPNCSGALSTPMTDDDIHDLAAAIAESVEEVHRETPWK